MQVVAFAHITLRLGVLTTRGLDEWIRDPGAGHASALQQTDMVPKPLSTAHPLCRSEKQVRRCAWRPNATHKRSYGEWRRGGECRSALTWAPWPIVELVAATCRRSKLRAELHNPSPSESAQPSAVSIFQHEQVLPAGFYWRTSRSLSARARAEWSFAAAAAAELVQDVGQCEPVPVLNAYIRLGKIGVGFVA